MAARARESSDDMTRRFLAVRDALRDNVVWSGEVTLSSGQRLWPTPSYVPTPRPPTPAEAAAAAVDVTAAMERGIMAMALAYPQNVKVN